MDKNIFRINIDNKVKFEQKFLFGNQYMEKVTPSTDDENKLNSYYTDDERRN